MQARIPLLVLALLCPLSAFAQEVSLRVGAEANAGSILEVGWTGSGKPDDYLAVVPAAEPSGTGPYAYAKDGNPAKLRLPDEPGAYLVQYRSGASAVLAQAELRALEPKASLQAPASAKAGEALSIPWTGPNNPDDFIAIQPAAAPGNTPSELGFYAWTKDGKPASLRAPLAPGAYEVRYLMGPSFRILARSSLTVR